MSLPRLYVILDAPCWPNAEAMFKAAEELVVAGCSLIQYRNKKDHAGVMLKQARELRRLFPRDESSHGSEKQPDCLGQLGSDLGW